MRVSSLATAQRSQKGRPALSPAMGTFSYPAPTGGWNASDPLDRMPVSDAVMLENYFPSASNVTLRNGFTDHATGMTSPVETLMTYKTAAVSKMWAVAGGKIYDNSTAGAVGAAAVSSLTNSRWQHVNVTVSGGNYISAVNGADSLELYDGSAWAAITGVSTPAITGVATTALINIFVFKKRLFFIEKNKLKLWFLAVDSITGAATAFDISAQFTKGGYLIAGGSLTRDGGDGLDDLFVAISSEGEVVIYQGTDPTFDFVLLGRYSIATPLGYRCMMRFGSDLAVMTIDGIIPLGQVLSIDSSKQSYLALTSKVRNAFGPDALAYRANFGFQGISYPGGQRFIFNVPITTNAMQDQYVQNSVTNRWCRFRGMNANCWALFNERLYFGGNNGKTYLSNSGTSDAGTEIVGKVQLAYNALDRSDATKIVSSIRANWFSSSGFTYGAAVVADFVDGYSLDYYTSSVQVSNVSSLWNVAVWNVAPWTDTLVPCNQWETVPGTGVYLSPVLVTRTSSVQTRLGSVDVIFTRGGFL